MVCSLRLGHRHFEERLAGGAEAAASSTLRIQLPESGYVTIGWPATSKVPTDVVCEALREALSPKALEFALAGGPPRHRYLEVTAETNSVTAN